MIKNKVCSGSAPSAIGTQWRKSRESQGMSNCVEVATDGGLIGVRDSKNPNQAVLVSSSCQWEIFIRGVKQGKFDL